MGSAQEVGEVPSRWVSSQWGQNMRAMQVRIKSRFRIAMTSRRLRQKPRRPGLVSGGSPALRATATGIVVARVFQGNVIFARMARNLAKQEWQKRVGWVSSLRPAAIIPSSVSSRFWSLLGYSAAGGALVAAEQQHQAPAQAEALAVATPVGSVHGSGSQEAVSAKRDAKRAKLSYYEELAIAQASDESLSTQIAQAVMLPAVAGACHVFMHGLNVTEVYGVEKLEEAIKNRPEGQSLITVCNHVAAMDDPLVMAALLPPSLFLQPKSLRWTLCATDRCFTNAAFSAFFRSVKVLPLKRGAGLQQEGIDIALSKLRRGDWVHIFPEGSRSRDGGKTIGTVRRGIGRLVTDVEKTPLVVPFVHTGMQDLMPVGSKFPKVSKKVSVLVGDPIELDDLIKESTVEFASKAELYDAIAVRVGQRMQVMKEELDQLVAVRELQLAAEEAERHYSIEKAQNLLQYVDWEAQGHLPESDSVVKEHYLDYSSIRNSDAFAQISGVHEQLYRAEQTNTRQELNVPDQKISESEMEEFFELEDDWDPLSRPSILSRVRGFVDTPTFLGLGFAARGFLSTRREEEGSELNIGWRYLRRQTSKPLNQVN
ncbi:hypothetical protein M758_10G098400 [Ceratodon purpureus]|uniref:Phospholipid/glycerol acyltransferase domain-containing protein n=1 Tax=Ceratodon purpureus TaxID=3225 RepID=A0A8T0GIP7_CERPU|nr:hypothetical protein KC19_10G100500 [Ceratodon purpureus]KAG0603501.1 hypothetical protein M758_10G098400 [Ceratodon purpureus]